jgi:Cu2+-exporting ATPase
VAVFRCTASTFPVTEWKAPCTLTGITIIRYTAPAVPGRQFIPAILGPAVFLYGGWPFIQGSVRELRVRLPGMMTLRRGRRHPARIG